MSCQVEQFADCGDVSSLARALFISDKDRCWLSECSVSLSPCGNLLAVGTKDRLCILTTQWISVSETNSFLISWSGTLPAEVTCLLVLSICPSQLSSQNGPDWFCIVVGFLNGNIGFYTNTGHLLLLEKLDENPVVKITCQTGTYGTLPDDIHILFQNCECIISGATLFTTLRDAKSQRAKVQAGVQDSYTIDSRSIGIRKWKFCDQETINDAGVVGLELKNTYDHLLAASTYGGYEVWYRSIPPVNTLILAAGTKPYIGFHYALEGGTTPPLQDVARAVANKIKSALPGWLSGGSGSSEQASVVSETLLRAESLALRSGVKDAARAGASVVVSPDRRLAAVTDSLGRLALLDLNKGHVIRLIKGCREAQCAFLQVFEQEDKKPHMSVIKELRRAIFLIIYNPRKGLIDIRLMQRGNRVVVFTATKNGILLYNTCGLVGTEKSYTHKKINVPEFQCVLLDPDGKLKRFCVPFFYALEGEHSEKSQDLHVLRELRDFIKRSDNTQGFEDVISEKCTKLKTLDLKKHCIEMLIRNYEISPKIIVSCLNIFWDEKLTNNISSSGEIIKNYFLNLCRLTQFYRRINNENIDDMQELITKMNGPECNINLPEKNEVKSDFTESIEFQLLEDDSCILERLLILSQEVKYRDHNQARVTFVDSKASTYKEFTSCFVSSSDKGYLIIKPDLSSDKINKLGSEIFQLILKMQDLTNLEMFVLESNIDPKDIVRLMIVHFMNMPLDNFNIEIINKLIKILYYISSVKNEGMIITYNEISPWWQDIRDMLVDMPCPLRSMVLAMACKAVSKIIEIKCSEVVDDAWESVTKESAKWGLFIGKLEDISILSIILMFKDTFQGNSLPKLELNEININLKYIYTRGKGSVTELIAKWLCSMGIPPEALITNQLMELCGDDNTDVTLSDDDGNPEFLFFVNNRDSVDNNPKIFKWISLLRRQFPLSTTADYVIANMAWEYSTSWQKNMQRTDELSAVVNCLENVSDLRLKHGLYCIIWSIIKPVLECCCRLVNKVGKLPKEPLCLQDVHLNTKDMLKFLEYSTIYLNKFFESTSIPKCEERQTIKFEKIWDESTPCLVEVAQDMKDVNDDVLNIIHQICATVYYQCHFNFKFSRPLDMLYDIDYQFVLSALTCNSLNNKINTNCSERVQQPRHSFVTKLIRHAIDTVTCEVEEGQDTFYNTRECDLWTDNIKLLARLWKIDEDLINRQQVIGFYHLGYDTIAEHLIGSCKEPQMLLPSITAITTQRFKRSLEHSKNQPEWIVTVPPLIYKRLQNTVPDATIPSHSSMATTEIVLHKVINEIDKKCITSTNTLQDIKLMQLMIETCQVLLRRKL